MTITLSVDAMGGDHGVKVTVPAVIEALKSFNDLHVILVGNESQIREQLELANFKSSALTIEHAEQVVTMDDLPSFALRNKKQSSMRIALNLVKENKAQACVSAGNTGALMATAKFVLKTLPGIDRPAICTSMPTMNGHVHMLDLGANVGADGESLAQFAIMGSVLVRSIDNNPNPTVGLLNIGQEEMKGHDRIKLAQEILRQSSINYAGFVEGDDIFKGTVDVVACDGFDGNIALKSSEGVAKMISFYLKQAFKRNILTKIVGLLSMPVLKSFKEKVDPRRYNGASFLGLQKIVIKSHGGADSFAYFHAIKQARLEVINDVPARIQAEVATLLAPKAATSVNTSEI